MGVIGYGKDCDQDQGIQSYHWKDNSILEIDLPSIKHTVSTVGGNSGSPLFIKRDGNFLAVGIHKAALKGAT